MKRIRIGNDINVAWSILQKDGTPFSLEGRDVNVFLRTPFGKQEVSDYIINNNVIEWTFLGKTQKVKGCYSLILVINEGANGMITTDSCDFVNLVSCSCQVGGEDNDGVQTEAIELTSTLGFIAYDDTKIKSDIANLQQMKADKSELTELSEEVSGLSEKVDELEHPIFKAIYGVTTYEEIKAAYDSGKVVHCDYNSYCYVLSRFTEGGAYFNAVNGSNSYRMDLTTDDSWSSPRIYQIEEKSNKVTTISESSTDTQYPSAKAVYDAIQQSGTPSGDPMHYMFEAVGATYNATDADIPMVGIYGDSYVHKAKHWHLNELGDITNEEMRAIYSERYPFKGNNYLNNLYKTSTQRTFICNAAVSDSGHTENYFIANSPNLKTVRYEGALSYVLVTSLTNWAYDCKSLQKILTKISLQYATSASAFLNAFGRCSSLEYVKLYKLSQSISFGDSPLLSKSSILYMIQNEGATAAITITLHADAYARAMANTEITAALEAHPNVSLASA